MKQLIVLCSTIVLGVFIYNLIMGESENSIAGILANVWITSIEERTLTP